MNTRYWEAEGRESTIVRDEGELVRGRERGERESTRVWGERIGERGYQGERKPREITRQENLDNNKSESQWKLEVNRGAKDETNWVIRKRGGEESVGWMWI